MRVVPVQTELQYVPVQSALLPDFWIALSLTRHRLPVVHIISVPDEILAVNIASPSNIKAMSEITHVRYSTNPDFPAFNHKPVFAEEADRFRQALVLVSRIRSASESSSSESRTGTHFWRMMGPQSRLLIHEMDGTAGNFHAILHSLSLGMKAGKTGEQSRMDIDQSFPEMPDNCMHQEYACNRPAQRDQPSAPAWRQRSACSYTHCEGKEV